MKRDSRTPPIIAIVLLLLPVLYVGSYLALIEPEARNWSYVESSQGVVYRHGYRNGGTWAYRLFWPLEQIDRKVRPGAWVNPGTPLTRGSH